MQGVVRGSLSVPEEQKIKIKNTGGQKLQEQHREGLCALPTPAPAPHRHPQSQEAGDDRTHRRLGHLGGAQGGSKCSAPTTNAMRGGGLACSCRNVQAARAEVASRNSLFPMEQRDISQKSLEVLRENLA